MHVSVYVCMVCTIVVCCYYNILYINNKQEYESTHIDLVSVCVYIYIIYNACICVYMKNIDMCYLCQRLPGLTECVGIQQSMSFQQVNIQDTIMDLQRRRTCRMQFYWYLCDLSSLYIAVYVSLSIVMSWNFIHIHLHFYYLLMQLSNLYITGHY